jgi:Kef-type K+ transport system membrane component KefB
MNVYWVAAVWMGMALLASLISIRTGVAVALVEIVLAAVVYAVMIETGLNRTDLGKLILAACFVTDFGTVLALGVLFADVSWLLLVFVAATVVALLLLPRFTGWFFGRVHGRVSEPEIKFLFLVLLGLGGLASQADSEAVLPAYLVGLVIAGVFLRDRVVVNRMRAISFALLTPFFFLRAGLLIDARALVSGLGVIAVLLGVKLAAKLVAVWPASAYFGLPRREGAYMTLLMATGLTFGSIAALYGLTNHLITQAQYSELVIVVILSAFVPTLIAQQFFRPEVGPVDDALEEALQAEDSAAPVRRPHDG